MNYYCSRNKYDKVDSPTAILKGLSDQGGLYIPEFIPKLDNGIEEVLDKDYKETSLIILKKFFDEFTDTELADCIESAYGDNFDSKNIVEIKKFNDRYVLELFHGKTIAFKDMALSLLPHLIKLSAKKLNKDNEIFILTATSGDTGKAALEAFCDVPDVNIIVVYPKNGVSNIQEMQMITQKGKNVHVIGVDANFDYAQSLVKDIMDDDEIKNRLEMSNKMFSSANSINIGRLIPQIIYYVYTCSKVVENENLQKDDKIDFVVPTGNFGNILAGYYAKKMGAPIGKLICASNDNNVLTEFFNTGKYDVKREFKVTLSPSMDIIISSNLERLLNDIYGEEVTKKAMNDLKNRGEYKLDKEIFSENFYADFATEDEVINEIYRNYKENSYVMDPHTAVASSVYNKYKDFSRTTNKVVILSTASPYKFVETVNNSLGSDYKGIEGLFMKTGIKIPDAVKDIFESEVRFNTVVSKGDLKDHILEIIF